VDDKQQIVAPDSTAVRVALWRALHVEVDAPPHVFEDEIGVKLAAPDLVEEQVGRGVGQYVILGAGLDTFAQRRPELASRLVVFEVDRPGAQRWKRQRLADLGFDIPRFLRFVTVDISAAALAARYFAGRTDGLRPPTIQRRCWSRLLHHARQP
jgi:O-methyltransferase involved in polyketide biosynthesis